MLDGEGGTHRNVIEKIISADEETHTTERARSEFDAYNRVNNHNERREDGLSLDNFGLAQKHRENGERDTESELPPVIHGSRAWIEKKYENNITYDPKCEMVYSSSLLIEQQIEYRKVDEKERYFRPASRVVLERCDSDEIRDDLRYQPQDSYDNDRSWERLSQHPSFLHNEKREHNEHNDLGDEEPSNDSHLKITQTWKRKEESPFKKSDSFRLIRHLHINPILRCRQHLF
jgi:hypothetical protein